MKLSIITINYNNLDGLHKTIDSIVNQTWRDFEWIVIDGGSTDGSKELIEKYQDYFAYWCSEPDNGVYNAMNKGISKAKGRYLNFMNSGDCFHNSTILEQVNSYLNEDDIVYGDMNFLLKNGGQWIYHYPQKLSIHFLLYDSIGHQASFIRRSLFDKDGYREDFKIVSDWQKFLKWFYEGRSFLHIDMIVADFDASGISATNIGQNSSERQIAIEELLGKKNNLWASESIEIQKLLEKYHSDGTLASYLKIKRRGGIRLVWLSRFVKFVEKTVELEERIRNNKK